MRVLSIWLPRLAVERWAKASDCAPDAPVVLTVEGTHGPVIHAVTEAAAGRGARPGARLTDARALDPALVALPADPAGDHALVRRLARWAERWSPLVEVDGADGLRLGVTGVAHLFGGEAALITDVRARFAALGLTVRVAVAETPGAAWALARFAPPPLGEASPRSGDGGGPPVAIPACGWHPPEGGRDLTPLPVAALRLDPDIVRTLERLGLKTVGALTDMPRLALARRFRGAESVVDALDRLTGRKPEPLTAEPRDMPPRALLRLEEPATHAEAPSQALERLIPELVEALGRRHLGARRLALTGFRVDGSIAVASVATSIPSREPKHLQRLLADKVAALDPGFGFDAFALEAGWCEPLGAAQDNLVEAPAGEQDVARLVDRLSVKLGPERVRRPVRHESHLPERASGWGWAISSPAFAGEVAARSADGGVLGRTKNPSTIRSSADGRALRSSASGTRCSRAPHEIVGRISPQRLLDSPEQIAVIYATPEGMPRRFVWRRRVHDIARVEGPERIAPEWWRERSTARLRDYYRVEDSAGRRYWIYREGVTGDGRGGAPAWFLHGLFG